MSDIKITIGFMAVLETPLGDLHTEGWKEANELIDGNNLDLEINYEGTLIFNKVTHVDAYNFDLLVGRPTGWNDFVKLCQDNGFSLKAGAVQPYFAHWYNGADSPMSDLSLDKFNEG